MSACNGHLSEIFNLREHETTDVLKDKQKKEGWGNGTKNITKQIL